MDFYSFQMYESTLQSSWARLITPGRNLVEVRWRTFSKYLPWQAMNFLQRSTHFSKTCCRPFITSKFLASDSNFMVGKAQNRMGRDLNWILCSAWKKWIGGTPLEHPPYNPNLAPRDFWAFPTMKRELQGNKFRSDQRSAARFREVGGAL
jgi:hypothetical protein